MNVATRALQGCLLALALLASITSFAAKKDGMAALQGDIARFAEPLGGVTGVAAWRLDGKGSRLSVRGDEAFPLASAFKVAVAGALLAQVDAGTLKLDAMVDVPQDKYVPSEVIADRFNHPGVSLSIYNLMELMLTQSDNTATDVLMDVAGGPTAITAWVRAQGVKEFRVDRDTAGVLRDFFDLPPGNFSDALTAAAKADPTLLAKSDKPNPAYDDDPRDTATPEVAAQLLTRIFSGKALSPASTDVLTGIMKRCRTGNDRIRGRLPPGTVVADKTGTAGGSVNDIGVIWLPGDAGQIVIAVFIKKSSVPFAQRERAIAEIARSVRDYYLYNAAP